MDKKEERLVCLANYAVDFLKLGSVDRFFQFLGFLGVTREEIVTIAFRICWSEKEIQADEKLHEEIGEVLSGLVGQCAKGCITRLASDPVGLGSDDDFVNYVREEKWTSQGLQSIIADARARGTTQENV